MGGGGGTPGLEITLISPSSPVSNRTGESRTFKAKVNKSNTIVKWKLDGVMVFGHLYPPANTELSYSTVAPSGSGSHELKVEAEKNGVLVSKSWIWNIDEIIDNCSKTHLSTSGNVYIKIENATLYKRQNGTYYLDVDWFVHGCETYWQDPDFPATRCEMTVTIGVSWDYIGIPGEPLPYPPDQVQEIDSCTKSGTNTFEVQSRACSVNINLFVKCYRYMIFLGMEDDSCYCFLGV
jgi:hypothetical protein